MINVNIVLHIYNVEGDRDAIIKMFNIFFGMHFDISDGLYIIYYA